MDKKRKRNEEDDESRMSSVQGEKKEKQSIPKETRFTLIVWPWGECRLIRGVGRYCFGPKWTGPVKDLAGQLELLEEGECVSVIEVSVGADGNHHPCPVLDTVDTLIYYGTINEEHMIDFPEEALAFPRLENLCFHWFNLRRIPPEILKTKIKWIRVKKIQEPPLFLLDKPSHIDKIQPLPWEPSIEDQLRPFRNLRQVLLLGLGEKSPTRWASFLKRGLYDPRLFLVVAEFLK